MKKVHETKMSIIMLLKDGSAMSGKSIKDELYGAGMNHQKFRRMLIQMTKQGLLVKEKTKYRLPRLSSESVPFGGSSSIGLPAAE